MTEIELRDKNGAYKGRLKDGNLYSENGMYVGRIDSNGNIYDSSGAYKGRVSKEKN